MKTCWIGMLSVLTVVTGACGSGEVPFHEAEVREGAVRAALETQFDYSAGVTSNATRYTVDRTLSLATGQTVTLGTCGVDGASYTGDTYLRLYNPAGVQVSFNNDECDGMGSRLTYTVPAGGGGDYQVRAGCYSEGSCSGTVVWTFADSPPPPSTGGAFSYSATKTAYGVANSINRTIALAAGQSIVLGTCGVPGSSVTGKSVLNLYDPLWNKVVSAYNGVCTGSYLAYTVPAGAGGHYVLRAGCNANESCSGTVAWNITSPPAPSGNSYSYSTYSSSTVNRTVQLEGGQTITVGTCGVAGSAFSGNTSLALHNGTGLYALRVAFNDSACGARGGAHFFYTVPPGYGGTYEIRGGCFTGSSCSGTVSWSIR